MSFDTNRCRWLMKNDHKSSRWHQVALVQACDEIELLRNEQRMADSYIRDIALEEAAQSLECLRGTEAHAPTCMETIRALKTSVSDTPPITRDDPTGEVILDAPARKGGGASKVDMTIWREEAMSEIINMTPEVATLVAVEINKILDAEPGAALIEIVLHTGDKSGRDGKPTDEVEVHAKYGSVNLIGENGNG